MRDFLGKLVGSPRFQRRAVKWAVVMIFLSRTFSHARSFVRCFWTMSLLCRWWLLLVYLLKTQTLAWYSQPVLVLWSPASVFPACWMESPSELTVGDILCIAQNPVDSNDTLYTVWTQIQQAKHESGFCPKCRVGWIRQGCPGGRGVCGSQFTTPESYFHST